MESVDEVMLLSAGGVATALDMIDQCCSSGMHELKSACRHLYHRLASVSHNAFEKTEAEQRYTQTLQKFAAFLQRYSDKSLTSRLIVRTKMMADLYTLHEEMDSVFCMLDGNVMDEWKSQWTRDCQVQMTALRAVVGCEASVLRQCRSTCAQAEAMVQLQFQLDRRKRQHSEELLELMRLLCATVRKISNANAPTVPIWFIPLEEIEYDKDPFAGGSFGKIHHGSWRCAKIVVKVLSLDEGRMDALVMKAFMDEVQIWFSLHHHPHVVKMFGASHVAVPPFIVCEDATNGDLAHFLAASDGNNKSRMWELLYQSALGLEHLHLNQIVHGDLKLNNILVGNDGQARIADFGLSTVKAASKSTPSRLSGTPATAAGAVRWRAPECFTSRPTFASDVFSFAMCIIEAATGEPPFSFLRDDLSVIVMVREGTLPAQPQELCDEDWALVTSMAKFVPSERLSLSEVLSVLKRKMELEKDAQREEWVCMCASDKEAEAIEGACSMCFRPRSQADRQGMDEQIHEWADEKAPSLRTVYEDESPQAVSDLPLQAPTITTTTVANAAVGSLVEDQRTMERDANQVHDLQVGVGTGSRGAEQLLHVVEIPSNLPEASKAQLEHLKERLITGAISQDEYDEWVPYLLMEDKLDNHRGPSGSAAAADNHRGPSGSTAPADNHRGPSSPTSLLERRREPPGSTALVATQHGSSGQGVAPMGSFTMIDHRVAIHGGYLTCHMHATQVLKDHKYDEHTVYVLRCHWQPLQSNASTTWLVSQRYSSFARLDKDLKAKIPTTMATLPPFPRKYRLSFLVGLDGISPEIVEERKQDLENYMGQVLEICGKLPVSMTVPELDRFLNVSHEVEQYRHKQARLGGWLIFLCFSLLIYYFYY